MSDDEYDKLSKEEREAKDMADREREASEQAGRMSLNESVVVCLMMTNHCDLALPYSWRQELGEVDIIVPVPKGTRARDLSITIQKKKLSVGIKGTDKILDGELCKEIKVEDSTWTLGKRTYVGLPSHLTIPSS